MSRTYPIFPTPQCRWAAILAERFGSELYLGHVLELPYRQNLMITALEIEEGIWERKRQ